MSVEAMKRAIGLKLTNPRAKPVLLALAWRADENNECYPGHSRLADDSGQSVPTVKRLIKDLVADGVLTVTNRTDVDGNPINNLYRLNLPAAALSGQTEPTTSGQDEPTSGQSDPTSDQCDPTPQFNLTPPSGQGEPQKEKQRKDKGQGKTKLSVEWKAAEPFRKIARERGLDEAQIDYQEDEFRDYWTIGDGSGHFKKNWLWTWRNAIDNQIAWKRGVQNLPRKIAPTSRSTVDVEPGTEQWTAWHKYHAEQNHTVFLREMDKAAEQGKSFPVPSPYPTPADEQMRMAA